MPMYQYKCDKCAHVLEVFRRISESDNLPDAEDLKGLESTCEHEWKRHFDSAPTVQRGSNWGKKGLWKYY